MIARMCAALTGKLTIVLVSVLCLSGFSLATSPDNTHLPGAYFRLLEAGYRIVYSPEAVLFHRAWRTPQSYLPLRWAYGVALGGFFAKHLTLRDRWIGGT